MVYKYEIIETSPEWYSVLKYNKLMWFKWKSWANDYNGLRESWMSYTDAEQYVKEDMEYKKHVDRVAKTIEVE